MINPADIRPEPGKLNPYEPALIAVLGEAHEGRPSAGRLAELRGLIRGLFARLPPNLKAKYVAAVQETVGRQDRGINGGPVFEKVTRLFDESNKRIWKSEEVCEAVGGDSKPILNVLGYLVRSNRILRIGRGQYLLPEHGTMILTAGELCGEPARYEGD